MMLRRLAARATARIAVRGLHAPVCGAGAFTDAELSIRDAAAAFCAEHLPPAKVLAMDNAARLDPALVRALHTSGFMGIEIPERHGGAGASFVAACLAIEEFAKRDASTAVMVDVQNTLVNNVFKKWGSPALQDWALPRLATSDVASFALSEPGSGSDAFALKTRATRDKAGGGWVIDGGKVWITNGAEAGLFLIFANVDPSKGHRVRFLLRAARLSARGALTLHSLLPSPLSPPGHHGVPRGARRAGAHGRQAGGQAGHPRVVDGTAAL